MAFAITFCINNSNEDKLDELELESLLKRGVLI